jgi:hypothetical protein
MQPYTGLGWAGYLCTPVLCEVCEDTVIPPEGLDKFLLYRTNGYQNTAQTMK